MGERSVARDREIGREGVTALAREEDRRRGASRQALRLAEHTVAKDEQKRTHKREEPFLCIVWGALGEWVLG
jgi:hypothetical protein